MSTLTYTLTTILMNIPIRTRTRVTHRTTLIPTKENMDPTTTSILSMMGSYTSMFTDGDVTDRVCTD